MIVVPPEQSALSLAHILNPISDNLDEQQDHPEMCPPLDKLPSTDEHIDAPLDGMMVDLLLLTASSSFQALDKVSMEIAKQESGGVKGATLSKKSGLLEGATVGAGKKRTQKDAEISSLNDSESKSSAKKTSKKEERHKEAQIYRRSYPWSWSEPFSNRITRASKDGTEWYF